MRDENPVISYIKKIREVLQPALLSPEHAEQQSTLQLT
jgi:hypothetical protein